MSNAESYTKASACHPKTAEKIASKASLIASNVNEPSPDVRSLAVTMISDFLDVIRERRGAILSEAIMEAVERSNPKYGSRPEAYVIHEEAAKLARAALITAANILAKNGSSVGKAIVAMNRNNSRYKSTSLDRNQRGRSRKPSIPTDAHKDSPGRIHSPKPTYQRPRPSEQRR